MGGGFNMFDPSAMAMMYQNMLKASSGGGGGMGGGSSGGGFDPNAMAMMYQNMMKGECESCGYKLHRIGHTDHHGNSTDRQVWA
jgi:hypothetical protein